MAEHEVVPGVGLDKPYAGIEKDEELGGWTFTCKCRVVRNGKLMPAFQSRGWPRKDQALERKIQHLREHVTADDPDQETVIAEPLEEFMARHGIAVNQRDEDPEGWRALLAEGEND